VADTRVPTDLEEAKDAASDLLGQVGAQVGDASEHSIERLEDARALLGERLVEARDVLADRAKTHGPELAAWARSTGSDLADRAGPVLATRAEQARDEVTRRWHDLEEDLPVDVDVETVGRQLERGAWQAVSALLSIVLLLPKLLVRGLGALGTLADDVSERGVVAGERAREVAGAVPPSKRDRRRRTRRTAAWTGAGFGLGLLVGWILGRRDNTTVTYEPADVGAHLSPAADPYPVPTGPTAAPVATPGEPAVGAGVEDADDAGADGANVDEDELHGDETDGDGIGDDKTDDDGTDDDGTDDDGTDEDRG